MAKSSTKSRPAAKATNGKVGKSVPKTIVTDLVHEKETSGTHRYKEVDEENPIIRTLYITKSIPQAKAIRVTIEFLNTLS
jgi:hypothetical protein